MKKIKKIIFSGILLIYLISISSLNVNAASSKVNMPINQVFTDNNMAQAVADTLLKSPDDIITQTDVDNTTSLYFFNKSINDITGISVFSNLNVIVLSENNLSFIPDEIGELSNLVYFGVNDNKISSLPTSLGDLANLTDFSASNNNISTIPSSIGNLVNLQNMYLNNNELTILPSSIGSLKELRKLELNNNNLEKLPDSITGLNLLEVLNVEYNRLSSLPNNVGDLSSLMYLQVNNNDIATVPSSIGNLNEVLNINLSNNIISILPTEIGNLKKITFLDVANNKLISLPESIINLTTLYTLNAANNRINNFSVELFNRLNSINKYLSNQLFTEQLDNGYITMDYTFDALPIYTQIPQFNDGSNIVFSLTKPDGTTTILTPEINNNKITLKSSILDQKGEYIFSANVQGQVAFFNSKYEQSFKLVNSKPNLTLLGANPMKITIGSKFIEPGYQANDLIDGDISSKVKVDKSSLNINKLGTYKLVYSVTNSFNETTSIYRIVNIIPKDDDSNGNNNKKDKNDSNILPSAGSNSAIIESLIILGSLITIYWIDNKRIV